MKKKLKNCIECQHHEIIADPDPSDWFDDNDVAVVCKKTLNDKRNISSKYHADHSNFKAITVACRPFKVKQECKIPSWCPLKMM